ncbi:ABC transporter permease [Paenibacillus sp. MER TA 81-3]|uniref:ABC transporter permease n=1 Tax=Paenibacillus sp. MER TA 81-3 TaxID=2939573 RepID=UPI00203B010C|nr:ABC transporter permease [Paenibacillus sp. MER TA 81-3]MCM3337552.1 ABC transporter permease [Paenibacillus sp. MER TA 81-3]
MERTEASTKHGLINIISVAYNKMLLNPAYKYAVLLLGLPVNLVVLFFYFVQRTKDTYSSVRDEIKSGLIASGYRDDLRAEIEEQSLRKYAFFGQEVKQEELKRQVDKITEAQFHKTLLERTNEKLKHSNQKRLTFAGTFTSLIKHPLFLIATFIPGLPMYILILLYGNSYLKYIFERLVMSMFVILGVTVLVFTILHLSPFHPAANILGETATQEQIAAFNQMHGLDQPYFVQLWNTLKGIATFDLGKSFSGSEVVTTTIASKFPITLTLTIISLVIAIIIALPIGIISATKPNSFFDYTFIFIALIGLSIPSFWQGLIFILNFSIKLQWLPATFNPQNWLSIIMPVVVLGTGLTAAVARMTRSSTLEVINEDYIMTAKAKGLSQRQVLLKHAVGNAIIPIITVIGLQFGGMLGGAAVTEKVFNISGIGSYIVDKQFIPDIPSIMGGVVYTAITISLVNVMIDILYAFFDPRIRSKMKQY